MAQRLNRKPDEWRELFDIQYNEWTLRKAKEANKESWDSWNYWVVINKATGEIVGEYVDRDYAVKQVRRRYKKIIKSMEKALLK